MYIVTGANGFIGSCTVWQLNQMGIFNILAVDTVPLSERNLLEGKSYSQFVTPQELWKHLGISSHSATSSGSTKSSSITPAINQEIKAFFHIGACSSTTETDWNYLFENNVMDSQRAFQFCTLAKVPLIYASSGATYGDGTLGFDDESDPFNLHALNLYGKSKLIFDQWALQQTETPPHWYGLRYFNVYGPNEYHKGSQASVIVTAFKQIHEVGSLRLFKSYLSQYKDGEQKRDFVYVKDITRWMMELLEKKPASGIYNMGTGQARTWVDLGRAVFKAMGVSEKFQFIEMPDNLKNQYQYFTEAKMAKFKSQNMSDSSWPLEAGVEDYVHNHLSHNLKLL